MLKWSCFYMSTIFATLPSTVCTSPTIFVVWTERRNLLCWFIRLCSDMVPETWSNTKIQTAFAFSTPTSINHQFFYTRHKKISCVIASRRFALSHGALFCSATIFKHTVCVCSQSGCWFSFHPAHLPQNASSPWHILLQRHKIALLSHCQFKNILIRLWIFKHFRSKMLFLVIKCKPQQV